MKTLTLTTAIERLAKLREKFRRVVSRDYETKARDCSACDVRGICCTDRHFVNVRVTTLEAAAINEAVERLPPVFQKNVALRTSRALEQVSSSSADGGPATYSCPLFEPSVGCLVHESSKPLPCIHHACYENVKDLPPDSLLDDYQKKVARLNSRTFGNVWALDPIPVALHRQE